VHTDKKITNAVTFYHQVTNNTMQPSDWAEAFEHKLKPLWLSALAGDNVAYEQSLGLIAQRLRGYFTRRLAALPAEVEDLVQETLMAIHLKRSTYDPDYAVTAWVLAIGKYKLVDFWRRHARTGGLHDDIDDTHESLLVTHAPEVGTGHDVNVLLQSLPEAQRTAIELTKLEGMTVTEAAKKTGMSVSAIKVNVHRGIKRLSELIRSK
jgi:RNA polymerase sigma-70 factor, ECF subfamily